ncbi:hypothetical protein D9M70_489280 [compost metagenome]
MIVLQRPRALCCQLCRRLECLPFRPLADQCGLAIAQAPGSRPDAADGKASLADHPVFDRKCSGSRNEGKFIGGAVTNLEIARTATVRPSGHTQFDDQLTGQQRVLEMRRISG